MLPFVFSAQLDEQLVKRPRRCCWYALMMKTQTRFSQRCG